MPRLLYRFLPTLRILTLPNPPLHFLPLPDFTSRTKVPGKNELDSEKIHRIRSCDLIASEEFLALQLRIQPVKVFVDVDCKAGLESVKIAGYFDGLRGEPLDGGLIGRYIVKRIE